MTADQQQIRARWEEINTIYEEAAIMRASLQEIARVSIPEINPDGDDQAADTMRLIALEALSHVGADVPEQRVSAFERPSGYAPTPRASSGNSEPRA